MTIESTFRELFSEAVTLYPPSAVDVYGKRSFSASGVTVPAHYVSETMLRHDPDGRDVVEVGRFYLYGQVVVDTDYRIVLDDGSEPPILAVDFPHDQNGWHHTVVRVGRG
jgi:hypothetical protein